MKTEIRMRAQSRTAMLAMIFLWVNVSFLPAQQRVGTFELGPVMEIESQPLKETRRLNIALPHEYADSLQNSYPVIYVLDGSANEDFLHIAGLVQFMGMYGLMEPTIVVGIANVDRKRDFTFPARRDTSLREEFPTSGGSGAFMDFMERELIGAIDKEFRTTDSRTIIGQSLGGLLATEVLFKRPYLFQNYLIISPSLWWDNEALMEYPAAAFGREFNQQAMVFVGVGDEHRIMEREARWLYRRLRKSESSRVDVRYQRFPEEDHATVLHGAVYHAFKLFGKEKLWR